MKTIQVIISKSIELILVLDNSLNPTSKPPLILSHLIIRWLVRFILFLLIIKALINKIF